MECFRSWMAEGTPDLSKRSADAVPYRAQAEPDTTAKAVWKTGYRKCMPFAADMCHNGQKGVRGQRPFDFGLVVTGEVIAIFADAADAVQH